MKMNWDKKRHQQLKHCGVGREAAGAKKSHSKGGLIEKNRILCSAIYHARGVPTFITAERKRQNAFAGDVRRNCTVQKSNNLHLLHTSG